MTHHAQNAPPGMQHAISAFAGTGVGCSLGLIGAPWWVRLVCVLAGFAYATLQAVFPQHSADRLTWWTDRRYTKHCRDCPCHVEQAPPSKPSNQLTIAIDNDGRLQTLEDDDLPVRYAASGEKLSGGSLAELACGLHVTFVQQNVQQQGRTTAAMHDRRQRLRAAEGVRSSCVPVVRIEGQLAGGAGECQACHVRARTNGQLRS